MARARATIFPRTKYPARVASLVKATSPIDSFPARIADGGLFDWINNQASASRASAGERATAAETAN